MIVDIEALDPSGDGVARSGRLRVLVPQTIPGERVEIRIVERRAQQARAVVESVVRASPHRVAPRCSHFGPPDECGGCAWQHIAYPEQLRLKTALVRQLASAALRDRAPAVRDTLPATPAADPWGYRQKVHFVFAGGGRDGPLIMGHYRRGSRRVFAARECPVHDSRGNAVAFAFHDACVAAGVAAARAGRGRAEGTLRHIAVRAAAARGETLATLVVTTPGERRLRTATQRLLAGGAAPDSLHLNVHARPDGFIFGPDTRRLHGARHLREDVAGTAFLVSPTSFFQTNVRAAEMLVRLVLEALPAGVPVLDLYAGVGLFAVPLARRGDRVVAVEESRSATNDAAAALRLNRVPPDACRVIAKRVEAAVRTVAPADARHVVLDPPREGCERSVIDDVFGRLRPERAVYVSCNPVALARDLALAAGRGYRIHDLQPVDMFPHTSHIETVALLTREGPARSARR